MTESVGTANGIGMDTVQQVRVARREFLVVVEEYRPRLYALCRRLTGNVWDAEDLVHDTLAKALARLGETHYEVDNPMAWLARIATNTYLDQRRADRTVPVADLEPAQVAPELPDIDDALEELMTVLPPQERAALVLKDVFGYSLDEIGSMIGTTPGAVKSALHRGRGKLAEPADVRPSRPAPDRAVLQAAAEAFTAYDVKALLRTFADDAVMDIVGMVYETGHAQMREGSISHTFDLSQGERFSAEVRDFDGEPVVAVWSTPIDGSGEPGLCEVWKCTTVGGVLTRVVDYFFCPEVMTEIAESWGVPTRLHGYRYA